MRALLTSLTALATGALAFQPLMAQNAQRPWTAEVIAPEPVPAPVGYVLAPGTTFVPAVFSEIGYDTNPNFALTDQRGSAFIRSGAGFNVSSVGPTTAGTFTASGSVLNYFNNDVNNDADLGPVRFAGTAQGAITTLVQPGVTFSGGGFVTYNEQDYNPNQTAGTNVELAYRDNFLVSVFKGRFVDVEYLNKDMLPASFVNLTSAFNYNRFEGTWTGLLGRNWFVIPYVEVSGALVNYTNQPNTALVNRSADDYYEKLGVRLPISPVFYTDVGWRFNERDTDDRRITGFDSNFFDGSLNWHPSPLFSFSASVERLIGEPSTNFGILADVRSYSVKVTYLPIPGVSFGAAGGWQTVTDIGSGVHYSSAFADIRAAWDYNSHVQFYTLLHYQDYTAEGQYTSSDSLRVMAGIKVIPDGYDLSNGESFESLLARLRDAQRPSNMVASVSAGYSWFGLPDMKMATVVGGKFFDQALGQITNGEGSMNGWRTDIGLANFASAGLPEGYWLSFGLSGFFANYQNTTNSHCMYSLTTDCAFVNIVDFSSVQSNNTGPFGNLNVAANRNVNYYGVAVDARLGDVTASSLKDGPTVEELSSLRVGLATRGLDETANLTSTDPLVSVPVKYKESVTTHYYGAFAGIAPKQEIGDGWELVLDATAGLYYTDVEYQGRYSGYTPIFGVGYVQEAGRANISLDRGSFIGTLKLGLNRDLGWGMLGVFGQGEYLSYVPRIAYNNNDQASFLFSWPIAGTQVGTRIKSEDAFNYTTGLSLTVKTN